MKAEWKTAYRTARIVMNSKPQDEAALCRFNGVQFKALAVLWYHRGQPDRLSEPASMRIHGIRISRQIIDEILKEMTT